MLKAIKGVLGSQFPVFNTVYIHEHATVDMDVLVDVDGFS